MLQPDSTFIIYHFEPSYEIRGTYTISDEKIKLTTSQSIPSKPFAHDKTLNLIFEHNNSFLTNKAENITLYLIRDTLWATYADENTMIKLNADSTFELTYFKEDYHTCGTFKFNGRYYILKDRQKRNAYAVKSDCPYSLSRKLRSDQKSTNTLFDKKNEIHLFYHQFGLGLKETNRVLVNMRKE